LYCVLERGEEKLRDEERKILHSESLLSRWVCRNRELTVLLVQEVRQIADGWLLGNPKWDTVCFHNISHQNLCTDVNKYHKEYIRRRKVLIYRIKFKKNNWFQPNKLIIINLISNYKRKTGWPVPSSGIVDFRTELSNVSSVVLFIYSFLVYI
jgi:hypothetical protein